MTPTAHPPSREQLPYWLREAAEIKLCGLAMFV
jgi:hypothetical protein